MDCQFDDWIFLALVALLPVIQPVAVRIGRYPVPPADFVFIGLALAFAATVLAGRRRVRWTPWCWTLVAYAAALAASAATSEDPRRSLLKLAGEWYLVGLAFLTFNYVDSARALRRTLVAWSVGTAITIAASAAGIALFLGGVRGASNIFLYTYGSLPPGPYPRVMALFLNANTLCTYVVASVMLLLAARASGWIGRRTADVLIVGTMTTAVFSLSPGLGGLSLAVGVWWWNALRERSPRLGALCLVGGLAGAAVFFVAITVSPVSLADLAPSSRVLAWRDTWHTFTAHPWLGRGLGLEVAAVRYRNASGAFEFLTDAHNTWLSILAQDGMVGLAAFVAVVLPIARRMRLSAVLDDLGNPAAMVRLGVELAFLGGFLYQTLSGSFENTRHVWALVGLTAAVQEPIWRRPVVTASP